MYTQASRTLQEQGERAYAWTAEDVVDKVKALFDAGGALDDKFTTLKHIVGGCRAFQSQAIGVAQQGSKAAHAGQSDIRHFIQQVCHILSIPRCWQSMPFGEKNHIKREANLHIAWKIHCKGPEFDQT